MTLYDSSCKFLFRIVRITNRFFRITLLKLKMSRDRTDNWVQCLDYIGHNMNVTRQEHARNERGKMSSHVGGAGHHQPGGHAVNRIKGDS
ncbi:hypothetical protein E4U58_006138 [Claviceps cyperi]|nr:hypothetical protein E4U58_006138 [Claviceps cyperi]